MGQGMVHMWYKVGLQLPVLHSCRLHKQVLVTSCVAARVHQLPINALALG